MRPGSIELTRAIVHARRNPVVFATLARWPFLAAVALFAAATSDVFVESVANSGAFGRAYFDTDDSSIVPSLVAALLLAGSVIGLHVLAIYRHALGKRNDWLVNVASDVAVRAPLRDFPAIVGMQFAVLFGMESVEQVAACGHLAGGWIWLGGPILASLFAHIAIGVLCTLVAGWLMRVSLASVASLVTIALEFVLCALAPNALAIFAVRRDARMNDYAQAACVRRISGRAPPIAPTPA